MGVCLRCGGTGITAFGEKCDCGAYTEMDEYVVFFTEDGQRVRKPL